MFGIHVRTPRVNIVKRSTLVPRGILHLADAPRVLRPVQVDLRPRVTAVAPAVRGVTRTARAGRKSR